MPNDSKRLGDLRTQYRNALLTITDEIVASDRSLVNMVAVSRIRTVLGVDSAPTHHRVSGPQLNKRIVKYVISLGRILQEMSHVDASAENQQVVGEIEADLNSLLQTAPTTSVQASV